MAEKDKIFYWIKLKSEFMNSEIIDFLMSQKNGANYVVLYQMLVLKTMNTQGQLCSQLGEMIIPFDAEKIQRECKWFDIDTVRIAMELYSKLGLIYKNQDGILQITNFKDMIGSETYWAQRKRIERKQSIDKQSLENVQENVQNPLISNIYNLNSNILDINNNTKDNNINNKNKKNNRVICPTLEQVKEYASQRGRLDLAESFFDYYSTGDWKDSKGNKVKNWKQKFITWEQHNQKPKQTTTNQRECRIDEDGVFHI